MGKIKDREATAQADSASKVNNKFNSNSDLYTPSTKVDGSQYADKKPDMKKVDEYNRRRRRYYDWFLNVTRHTYQPPQHACGGFLVSIHQSMKTCRSCGVEKPFSEFIKDKNRPDGHYVYCKLCNAARRKEKQYYKDWRKNNPDKVVKNRRTGLLRKYGLTEADYNNLLAKQS